ncbi:MAG: hypothetical protein ACOYK9_02885 [Chlamydiia bacterium]
MAPLKVVIHSTAHDCDSLEKTECLLDHLKSCCIEPHTSVLGCIDPKVILEALQTSKNTLALISPSIRFLVDPTHFSELDCDIAVFTNKQVPIGKKDHIDSNFILFQSKPKTIDFLHEWIEKLERKKDQDPLVVLNQIVKTKALSMQILHLSPHLKISNVAEQPAFHRWLMEV